MWARLGGLCWLGRLAVACADAGSAVAAAVWRRLQTKTTPTPLPPPFPLLLQVSAAAADAVLGLSAAPDGAAALAPVHASLLPALLRLGGGSGPAAEAALGALVTLSQDPAVAGALVGHGAIARAMDGLRDADDGAGVPARSSELRVMLLANLTATEAGSDALLQVGGGALEGFNL